VPIADLAWKASAVYADLCISGVQVRRSWSSNCMRLTGRAGCPTSRSWAICLSRTTMSCCHMRARCLKLHLAIGRMCRSSCSVACFRRGRHLHMEFSHPRSRPDRPRLACSTVVPSCVPESRRPLSVLWLKQQRGRRASSLAVTWTFRPVKITWSSALAPTSDTLMHGTDPCTDSSRRLLLARPGCPG